MQMLRWVPDTARKEPPSPPASQPSRVFRLLTVVPSQAPPVHTDIPSEAADGFDTGLQRGRAWAVSVGARVGRGGVGAGGL